mmetsp:Transcript_10034/g.11287  ORF Transcript_10034/g.11287 Transcript_10034/m.11287 type:complete len:285 (-) Transcript_10034:142-996(-)
MREDSLWKGTSDEKLQEAEDKLVELSGIDLSLFKSYKVDIEFEDQDYLENYVTLPRFVLKRMPRIQNYIWTYEIGENDGSKPVVVLIHGYGMSSMVYYRTFKKLSEKYHVIAIDLLGFGRSSRPEFKATTIDECEHFFVNSIEMWREKMGLTDLTLICHSFGGYIGALYSSRYPEYVKQIMFLSPLGTTPLSTDIDSATKDFLEKQSLHGKLMIQLFYYMPPNSFSPYSPLRLFGRLSSYIVHSDAKMSYQLPENEIEIFASYHYQILLRSGSGEFALGIMFRC